jgi:hypothetical protein
MAKVLPDKLLANSNPSKADALERLTVLYLRGQISREGYLKTFRESQPGFDLRRIASQLWAHRSAQG